MKADIFFVVTTLAVVLLTIGLVISFYYVIRILRDVKYLSNKAKEEGEEFLRDLRSARMDLKEKSGMAISFVTSLLSFALGRSKRAGRRAEKKTKPEDSL